MNISSFSPRFGKLDTTPLREADLPRSLIPMAEAMADGFEQRLATDRGFAQAINYADSLGLDLVVTGDFFKTRESGKSTLDVMASFTDRATGKAPDVAYVTGAGRSGIEAADIANKDQILDRLFYNLSGPLCMVPDQFSRKK